MREIKKFVCREDYPVAETGEGRYRGFLDGDVFCFRGLAYAKARRFHEPEPADPFDGIRNALDYGPVDPGMSFCVRGSVSEDNPLTERRLWYKGENSLNLNIWTRSFGTAEKKPVMVWMHGGGFAFGNTLDLQSYDGWEMCHSYDVVVVTVNHRLNMSGFLDLSEFGEQYAHSGILGMMDLVAALRWVQDNIEAFGGDPGNVTIYGQSGGGKKVTALMQMPAADGLYHKAIIQSGVMRAGTFCNHSARIARLLAKDLGLKGNNISRLEKMEYEELGAAVMKAIEAAGMNAMEVWAPAPDGREYIGNPMETGFRKETADIPLIVGSCLAEFDPVPAGDKKLWDADRKQALLLRRFGEHANAVETAFEDAYPWMDPAYASCVDLSVRPAVIDFLNRRKKEAAAPVYNYLFAYEAPLLGGQLLGHNGDLHFMFHNALYIPALWKADITARVQDEMAGAWAAFAKTGSPNGEGLPLWEEYEENTRMCMIFGDRTVQGKHHDRELMKVFHHF